MSSLWLIWLLLGLVFCLLVWTEIGCRIEERRLRRQRRIQWELDRKQNEMRQAVLRLAEALAVENTAAQRASADLLRANYIARGELPRSQS